MEAKAQDYVVQNNNGLENKQKSSQTEWEEIKKNYKSMTPQIEQIKEFIITKYIIQWYSKIN